MKAPIIGMGLAFTLATSAVFAQGFLSGGRGSKAPAAPAPAPAPATDPAPKDPNVVQATTVVPAPVTPAALDEMKPATLALPTDPIEPYLLTKQSGPFMVTAKTFRGPDAERYALALVLELRRDYNLPAYILRTKDFPKLSNIRNVPPTAPSFLDKPQLTEPEKVRTYDEAAVLVGNEPTLAAQDKLWHSIKKIKPRCLNQVPTIWGHRDGLSKALKTTNPYVPAQALYPGRNPKRDRLIAQMNDGPRSVFHCPGRYSLEVANFTGRATYFSGVAVNNPQDPRIHGNSIMRESPLARAAEDAEKLADTLAKDPEIQKAGCQPYVYHDLTTSRVMVGSFDAPNDPRAVQLRQMLTTRWMDLMVKSKMKSMTIAPATYLTDLEPIKANQ